MEMLLKVSQTLTTVAAMGVEVIGVNYSDPARQQRACRNLAKKKAALVRTDIRENGDKI